MSKSQKQMKFENIKQDHLFLICVPTAKRNRGFNPLLTAQGTYFTFFHQRVTWRVFLI